MSKIVTTDFFSGAKNIHGKNGLSSIIKGVAIDLARSKVAAATIVALTDNTTGVAAASVVGLTVPTAPFDASSAGGAQLTGFNTAMGKIEDAGKVLVNAVNLRRTTLGLSALVSAVGTEAAANTIPAQDKTITTASGTSAVSYLSGRAAMLQAKSNFYRLLKGTNDVLLALGLDPIASADFGSQSSSLTLADIPAGTAAAASPNSAAISKAAADAFFTAYAANYATLAAKWNAVVTSANLNSKALSVVAGA